MKTRTLLWLAVIAACPKRVLRAVDRLALLFALSLFACGGSSDDDLTGDAAGDVGADTTTANDAAGDGDAELLGDVDASDAFDVNEAAPCTPFDAALPMPSTCDCDGTSIQPCPGATGQGCAWVLGPVSNLGCHTSTGCWSVPINGSSSCEACKETYTCACLMAPLIDSGLSACSCMNGTNGPYLVCP